MLKITPHSLSPEEVDATSTYLKDLSDRSSNLTVAVQSLFARCNLSALRAGSNLDELGREAAALGKRILNHPEPDQLGLDPVLLIEIYRLLSQEGTDVAEVRCLLGRIALELLAQPAEAQSAGRVRFIASQLASLGFPIRQAKPAKQIAAMLKKPEGWFTASVAELAEIADHLLADRRPLDDISVQILSLIALAELRNYRVDLGCVLLRAMFQLGKPCAESIEALNFIALQRRRDGRYGFANQFAESSEPGDDQHLSLYLPLTVNAVWLLSIAAAHRRQLQVAVSA